MKKFSVIVPVYKVETYLDRCVESVLKQTFTDFELILVDDGSPDRCGEMCDSYAAMDNRVVVIHQENAGVSVARNRGIEVATGEFVAFVDADDYVSIDFLQCAYDAIRQHPKAEIVQFCWRAFDECVEVAPIENGPMQLRVHGTEDAMADFLRFRCFTHAPWGKVIRRSLLEDIEFPRGIKVGEDLHVSYRLLGKATNIVSTDAVVYYYCVRGGSAMTSRGPSAVEDAMWVFGQMNSFCHEHFPSLMSEADRRYANDLMQLLRDLRPMRATAEKKRVENAVKVALAAIPNATLPKMSVIMKALALRCPPLYFMLYKIK